MALKTANKTRLVDIAEAAGVSLATVGRVLQGTGGGNIRVSKVTAEKIMDISKKLNYVPNYAARQLAGKKSSVIGILIDPRPYPANSIRLAEMGFRARQRGYHLMTLHEMPEPNRIEECITEFKGRGVDGIVCVHHAYPGQHDLVPRMIMDAGLSNVIFIDNPNISDAVYVGLDFPEVARIMVRHLLGKGRKRIAMALSDLDWYTGPCFYQGYKETLIEQGYAFDEGLVWIGTDHIKKHFDNHSLDDDFAKQIVDELCKKNNADAIVVGDDSWAAQIINALHDAGYKVPEDVAVTGSGNMDISQYLRPRITTADLCHREISHKAIDMLIDSIESSQKNDGPNGIILKPKLILRDSA